jgi:hypothetical protein
MPCDLNELGLMIDRRVLDLEKAYRARSIHHTFDFTYQEFLDAIAAALGARESEEDGGGFFTIIANKFGIPERDAITLKDDKFRLAVAQAQLNREHSKNETQNETKRID